MSSLAPQLLWVTLGHRGGKTWSGLFQGDWPGNDSSLGMRLWKSSSSVLLPPHWERRLLPRPQLSWGVGHRTRLSWNHSSSCVYWVSWLNTLGCCKPLVNFRSSEKSQLYFCQFFHLCGEFSEVLTPSFLLPVPWWLFSWAYVFLCPPEMPRREIIGSQSR